jgi:UDP:flavonoid glycosyltransferase YjiC (YdhE family)
VGGEQHDNASRIEFFRMGCRLDMDSLSDEALRSTVEKIRNNTEMNRRLEDVSKELRNSDGITSSVRLIEWVMEHRRPFAKKNHLPQTISKHMLDQYLQD